MIGKRWVRRGSALVAVLAVLGALTACRANNEGNPFTQKVACSIHVAKRPWIYQSPRHTDVQIKATVLVRCNPQHLPTSHKLEVWLERDVTASGNWLIQGNIHRNNKVPDPTVEVTTVFDGCISGSWRVQISASGVGPEDHTFKNVHLTPDQLTFGTVKLQCPGPKHRG